MKRRRKSDGGLQRYPPHHFYGADDDVFRAAIRKKKCKIIVLGLLGLCGGMSLFAGIQVVTKKNKAGIMMIPSDQPILNTGTTATSQSTSTISGSSSNYNDPDDDMINELIRKWNLVDDADDDDSKTTKTTIRNLLKQIWKNQYDYQYQYHPHEDLIVFHHPLKTGGTTLSDILVHGFGGMGSVVPGSRESDWFNYTEFNETYQKEVLSKTTELAEVSEISEKWWDTKKVLFSHTKLRYYRPPNRETFRQGKLARLLRQYIPPPKEGRRQRRRRLRLITMFRDPLNLVASNFHEWYCEIRGLSQIAKHELHIQPTTTPTNNTTTPECSGRYSLQDLTRTRIYATKKQCHHLNITNPHEMKTLSTQRERNNCKIYHQKLNEQQQQQQDNKATDVDVMDIDIDPQPECTSISRFLESDSFDYWFRNMYQNYTLQSVNATSKDWIIGALECLGGLDTDQQQQLDMMWFGITERMLDSICLFHYQTGLPWNWDQQHGGGGGTGRKKIPTRRVFDKECRPTRFWTEADKASLKARKPLDYAVHKVANAILDLKLIQMRQDLWYRILVDGEKALLLEEDSSNNNNNNNNISFTTLDCLGPKPTVLVNS